MPSPECSALYKDPNHINVIYNNKLDSDLTCFPQTAWKVSGLDVITATGVPFLKQS